LNIDKSYEIYRREPVWVALSQFYLDTELDDLQLLDIFKVIQESPYSIEEARKIDMLELYPVLKFNIFTTAGESEGFDEEWLIDKLTDRFKGNLIFKSKLSGIKYWLTKKLTNRYWVKLDKIHHKLNS